MRTVEDGEEEEGQEVQSHNNCPQRTSRGGYELLSRKTIEEKIKERQASSDVIPPPSPPTRHEQWKRARIKSGEYITPEVKIIVERI
ncbi:hypothetical protein CASFOL_029223 [Castilleja foliolosa]|uniref:Uncharacterized protein n=1 Tax=Castilleja foliolosa TaxID=1961234 RepID=A0ABD3CDX7_9LAMI